MKLSYRVLWFEDDNGWLASINQSVQEIIEEEYGFVYKLTHLKRDSDDVSYNDYDLILMDMNLEDAKSGDSIVKKIRERDIYTDVVFYSSAGITTVRERASKEGLEGVYFSGRGRDVFLDKLQKVISTTILKVQDLNNLRGLVMAEVSELDVLMEKAIRVYFVEKGDEVKTKAFRKHIVKNIEETVKKRLKSNACAKDCSHNWSDQPIDQIIDDFDFDTSKKARAVKLIIDSVGIIFTANKANFYEDYLSDVIILRNNLAHCASEIVDGVEVLHTKKDDTDIIFDFQKFKEIRKQLQYYHSFLSEELLPALI